MEQEELLNSIWETIALPEKINEPKSCCNNQQRYDNDEYIICVNCGIILEQIINENKESSYANNNDGEKGKNNERCGASTNPLIPSISMNSTVIAGNSNLSRIQNWLNNDSISYSEKVLMKYKYRIGELVNLYNISGDISTAILYKIKELIEMKEKLGIIHRGKNYSGLIGACFYYSCKESEYNIPPLTIIEMFEIDISTFNKCCKIYKTIITTGVNGNIITKDNSLITRFFGSLELSNKILMLGIKIMKSVEALSLANTVMPQNIISGLIEFLNVKLDLKIEMERICYITKAKESTVRKNYKMYLKNEIMIYNHMKYYS